MLPKHIYHVVPGSLRDVFVSQEGKGTAQSRDRFIFAGAKAKTKGTTQAEKYCGAQVDGFLLHAHLPRVLLRQSLWRLCIALRDARWSLGRHHSDGSYTVARAMSSRRSGRAPVCACAPSTFLQGNTTTCEICPMHHECAGIFSPPQPCGIHRVTLVAGGSCVCADAFAPSADDRCVACPPSAWCRDGVEHVCPSHSLAAVPNASSCVCAPGAAPATRWVPWLGNVSNRVPVDVSIEFNLSLLLPSNMSQAVYVLRDVSTENVWVPAQNTSIACRPCDPGTFCHGGQAEPVACGPGRTSVRGASSRAACHCLPPLTPQAGACVDPSTVMATLQVEAQDLAALAPGAIRVADALGCGLPPHGLRGVCPAVTRVVVENSTHLALFLENMIVRPAYLGLLYAFLEDAHVLRESYAVYQETWEAVIGRGHSGARCVAHVSTESLEGEDPSEVHYEAVRAAWDAAAHTCRRFVSGAATY